MNTLPKGYTMKRLDCESLLDTQGNLVAVSVPDEVTAFYEHAAYLKTKPLLARIAELEAALQEIDKICEQNMGSRIPNIEKVVMRVLAKKAGGNE